MSAVAVVFYVAVLAALTVALFGGGVAWICEAVEPPRDVGSVILIALGLISIVAGFPMATVTTTAFRQLSATTIAAPREWPFGPPEPTVTPEVAR